MNIHRPRGILWQLLRVRFDDSFLWIGNVHADSMAKDQGFEFLNPAATLSSHRMRQINECFNSALDKKKGLNTRVIIAGDFNTTKDLGELKIAE